MIVWTDWPALLDGPRARGAFLLRCLMDPPWSVRLEDESPLSLTAVVRGDVWAMPDGGEPFLLEAGDVVVALGPDHWTIADDPATRPQVVIHPGQHCTTVDGQSLEEEMHQGVRSWGNSAVGETVMLTGAYLFEGEVSRRLLRALPRFVVLSERELGSPLVALLAGEIVKDEPGPGRRPRPAARPAPDRGAAGLVRAPRGRRRRRGTSARATLSSDPRCG